MTQRASAPTLAFLETQTGGQEMIKRQTLIPLGALLAVCFVGAGLLKHEHSGVLGVLSGVAWFGFLALAIFFIAVAMMTIVRNRRRLNGSRS
jgi:hypothetical protein